jgi:hypothetical protein
MIPNDKMIRGLAAKCLVEKWDNVLMEAAAEDYLLDAVYDATDTSNCAICNAASWYCWDCEECPGDPICNGIDFGSTVETLSVVHFLLVMMADGVYEWTSETIRLLNRGWIAK